MMSTGRLKGKVALITGGTGGYGECIVRLFAAEGAIPVVADLDQARGEELIHSLGSHDAKFVCADVTLSSGAAHAANVALDAFDRIDILVNGATAIQANQPMLNVPEALFDRIFAVNCKSIYLTAKSVLPAFRRQGGGMILNLASSGAMRPHPGLTWYNGAKGAVIALTRAMAAELAVDGIRVNAISPSLGETEQLPALMGLADTPTNRAKYVASIPLGRLAKPQDVAGAALYLASDEAAFITGTCLEVDGGRHL